MVILFFNLVNVNIKHFFFVVLSIVNFITYSFYVKPFIFLVRLGNCLIFYDIIKYSLPDSSFSVPLAHPSIFVSI